MNNPELERKAVDLTDRICEGWDCDNWNEFKAELFEALLPLLEENERLKKLAGNFESLHERGAKDNDRLKKVIGVLREFAQTVKESFCNDDTERYYSTPDWNEDAHVEVTLTVKDVRLLFKALAEAERMMEDGDERGEA